MFTNLLQEKTVAFKQATFFNNDSYPDVFKIMEYVLDVALTAFILTAIFLFTFHIINQKKNHSE